MSRKNVLLLIAAGLALLFERFGYYAVRAVLMLVMVKQMQLPQAEASVIYGEFTEQVFLMVFAGAVAVLVLGARMTTILGVAIAAVGVGLLAPMDPSMLSAALFLVALGSGLFKVGLYASAGAAMAESSGVTAVGVMMLFHVAVNVGAFFAPLVAGTAAQVLGTYSMAVSMGLAGMVLALITFAAGAFASGTVREPFRFERPRALFGALLYVPAMLVVYVLFELISMHSRGLAAGTGTGMMWLSINPLVVMAVGVVAGVVFLAIGRIRGALRVEWIFATGILLCVVAALFVLEPGAALPQLHRVILAEAFRAAGEVILTGAVVARLAAGTSPRLAALVVAPYLFTAVLVNFPMQRLSELPDTSTWTWGFAVAATLFGAVAVALSGVFQRSLYAESAASQPAPVDVEPTAA